MFEQNLTVGLDEIKHMKTHLEQNIIFRKAYFQTLSINATSIKATSN